MTYIELTRLGHCTEKFSARIRFIWKTDPIIPFYLRLAAIYPLLYLLYHPYSIYLLSQNWLVYPSYGSKVKSIRNIVKIFSGHRNSINIDFSGNNVENSWWVNLYLVYTPKIILDVSLADRQSDFHRHITFVNSVHMPVHVRRARFARRRHRPRSLLGNSQNSVTNLIGTCRKKKKSISRQESPMMNSNSVKTWKQN